jgi:hypothetical protein
MSLDPTHSGPSKGSVAQDVEPPLERLRTLLLDEGGLMSGLVLADALPEPPARGPAQVVAEGPRAEGSRAEYELLVETIYEGYLLHYHDPRVVHARDPDLGLLAGDRLYALGLARLVGLGDIEGVAELADVITLSALAHGAGRPELADEIWMAGARAVGWGGAPRYEHAKALVRAGSPAALEALRAISGS